MNSIQKILRVLVIDDRLAHSEGLAELLSLKGFETTSTTSGLRGLELISEWKPDAVLTDIDLPDINGYEVCKQIRSKQEWRAIAVIFHTGSQPMPVDSVEYDAFLTYPVETGDLIATITGSVMRRRKIAITGAE
jgi:two-component system OmpR family response regulator